MLYFDSDPVTFDLTLFFSKNANSGDRYLNFDMILQTDDRNFPKNIFIFLDFGHLKCVEVQIFGPSRFRENSNF